MISCMFRFSVCMFASTSEGPSRCRSMSYTKYAPQKSDIPIKLAILSPQPCSTTYRTAITDMKSLSGVEYVELIKEWVYIESRVE